MPHNGEAMSPLRATIQEQREQLEQFKQLKFKSDHYKVEMQQQSLYIQKLEMDIKLLKHKYANFKKLFKRNLDKTKKLHEVYKKTEQELKKCHQLLAMQSLALWKGPEKIVFLLE